MPFHQQNKENTTNTEIHNEAPNNHNSKAGDKTKLNAGGHADDPETAKVTKSKDGLTKSTTRFERLHFNYLNHPNADTDEATKPYNRTVELVST